jgi:hypothetical protein
MGTARLADASAFPRTRRMSAGLADRADLVVDLRYELV